MSAAGPRTSTAPEGGPVRLWTRLAPAAATLPWLALLAAPLGARTGLWDFSVGLALLRWTVYLGAGAFVVNLAAAVVAARAGGRTTAAACVLGALLAAGAAAVPLAQYRAARALPRINDLTTDPADPPRFVAAGRGAANGAAGAPYPVAFADRQRAAYPDLRTMHVAAPPQEAFDAALAAARGMPRWSLVLVDPAAGRIEAVAETRWFGWRDDVVVRVRGADGAMEVDVRSRSRVGIGDAGANARRIREFLERLAARLGPGAERP